jgi:hypothetical protein
MHDHFRSDRLCRRAAAKAAMAMPVIALTLAVLITGCGAASAPHANGPPRANARPPATGAPVPSGAARAAAGPAAAGLSRGTATANAIEVANVTGTPRVTASPPAPAQSRTLPAMRSAPQAARLSTATTYETTPAAPQDPAPFKAETGIVIHPATTRVIYARPGGPAVGALPATELGSPTWVPVVQSQPGWDRILLPTRPNHSTGWIYLGGGALQTAYTPYQVSINLASHRLTILDAGHRLGSWAVAVGAPGTPTPTGRTFVLASLAPPQPTYTPLILPLGVHSSTLSTFGGGPGTVGLHGWPDPAVFGHSVSHGCVRVPAAALRALSRIPLGSAVMITG